MVYNVSRHTLRPAHGHGHGCWVTPDIISPLWVGQDEWEDGRHDWNIK
jgi:hypothetical protein